MQGNQPSAYQPPMAAVSVGVGYQAPSGSHSAHGLPAHQPSAYQPPVAAVASPVGYQAPSSVGYQAPSASVGVSAHAPSWQQPPSSPHHDANGFYDPHKGQRGSPPAHGFQAPSSGFSVGINQSPSPHHDVNGFYDPLKGQRGSPPGQGFHAPSSGFTVGINQSPSPQHDLNGFYDPFKGQRGSPPAQGYQAPSVGFSTGVGFQAHAGAYQPPSAKVSSPSGYTSPSVLPGHEHHQHHHHHNHSAGYTAPSSHPVGHVSVQQPHAINQSPDAPHVWGANPGEHVVATPSGFQVHINQSPSPNY